MRRFMYAAAAFVTTLGVGAALCLLSGVQVRAWLPVGIVTSVVVAISVYRSRPKKEHSK